MEKEKQLTIIEKNMNEVFSVCIITYNSEPYIIETLESIKSQTYENIELIISDDCSKDSTVEICTKWLSVNGGRFVHSKILSSDKNQGIVKNANQAYKASTGYWIKLIAGDDLLHKECIKSVLNFIKVNPDCRFCFVRLNVFGDKEMSKRVCENFETLYYPKIKFLSREKQYLEIIKDLFIPGPGVFIEKMFLDELGGYDENYKYGEEHPYTLKALKKEKLFFIDQELVSYRVYSNSACRKKGAPLTYNDNKKFFYHTRLPLMIINFMPLFAIHQILQFLKWDFDYFYEDNCIFRFISKHIMKLSPYRYKKKIYSLLLRISYK